MGVEGKSEFRHSPKFRIETAQHNLELLVNQGLQLVAF